VWPPDDTEESILGTDLHQMTIINLRWGINELAHRQRAPGEPLHWQALCQLEFLGCVRRDGSAYTTYPDLCVFPHPVDQTRGSFSLREDGPPVLIVEVLSPSTYEWDLDLERGKGYSYAQAGVREYLALDPTGSYVREGGRGWRLENGRYIEWERDRQGQRRSRELGIAIALEGALATVYTPEGRRLLREGEVEEELARKESELALKSAEIERLRRQLDDLKGTG
jgi:hypothetical protein